MEPVNHLITGVLKQWATLSGVESIRVPGYWTHKKGTSIPLEGPPKPDEKILYMLHGGAYIRCSAHPGDMTFTAHRSVFQNIPSATRLFSIEYRLVVENPFGEAHPFPTQLIDALAGYNYLVNVIHFDPKNIIIGGDSAGGNLAHALTRFLVEYQGTSLNGGTIPKPPGALILLSPWLDMSPSHEDIPNSSVDRNRVSDYIGSQDGSTPSVRVAFTGPHGLSAAATNPYISPASLHPDIKVSFVGFPRTFILAGDAEVLRDQIATARDRMIRDLGEGDGIHEGDGKLRYFEAVDATHDFLAGTFFEPERSIALKEINRWATAE